MTTTPSETTSAAMVPVRVSPCCVVALSRVWVMRMGSVVPGVRVMLRKAGRDGGGGGGGGCCAGGGGGAGSATWAGVSGGEGWRTIGADFCLMAAGCFGLGATGAGGGGSAGGGVEGGWVATATAGAGD